MNRLILFMVLLFPISVYAFGSLGGDASAEATATAVALGASKNVNTNTNLNANLNANKNVNSVTSSNSLSNSNSASSYNRNYNQDYQGQAQGQSIKIRNEAPDLSKMVPDAGAPALTTSNGTCMGSTSVGGSGIGFGASIGSTWTDKECNARYNAQLMYNMGYKDEALQILCRLDDVYAVMGDQCHNRTVEDQEVAEAKAEEWPWNP